MDTRSSDLSLLPKQEDRDVEREIDYERKSKSGRGTKGLGLFEEKGIECEKDNSRSISQLRKRISSKKRQKIADDHSEQKEEIEIFDARVEKTRTFFEVADKVLPSLKRIRFFFL